MRIFSSILYGMKRSVYSAQINLCLLFMAIIRTIMINMSYMDFVRLVFCKCD